MEKRFSIDEARKKIRRYCAYQERAHREVREKLFSYGLSANEVDQVVVELIEEGFLNEERFARAFVGGKFRIKKWGRLKIIQGLETKGVSTGCIKLALTEIDEQAYVQTLSGILKKQHAALDEPNIYVRRDKLSKFAIQKGFESDLVWKMIRELFPDGKQ